MENDFPHKIHKGVIVGISLGIAAVILRSMIWLLPSPLMSIIMADMGLSYVQGGMLMFVVTALMGVSMFGASLLIDRLGATRVMVIALICFGLDGILAKSFQQYAFVLIGRIFMAWTPLAMTMVMTLPDITPSVVSGAYALMTGGGSLLAFFAPFAFDALQKSVGMKYTFLIFA